jgi:Resolvase, N terminal domain
VIPAVIYGAKSTQDRRRSIDTQLEDAREKCADEGWTVVGRDYADEGFSAYTGDRGPDLGRPSTTPHLSPPNAASRSCS